MRLPSPLYAILDRSVSGGRDLPALLDAVLHAGEHGLDPALFHGAVLRNPAALPAIVSMLWRCSSAAVS